MFAPGGSETASPKPAPTANQFTFKVGTSIPAGRKVSPHDRARSAHPLRFYIGRWARAACSCIITSPRNNHLAAERSSR